MRAGVERVPIGAGGEEVHLSHLRMEGETKAAGSGEGGSDVYHCPVCGEELNFDDKVYRTGNRVVIGCERCIDCVEAEDALEERRRTSIW